jgi:hypothetical protein
VSRRKKGCKMVEKGLVLSTMADVERAAQAMAGSGFFQDTRQAAQAVVKILAGQEMGFGPFSSMTGVYIIQGRPAIGANLMAAAVKRHPKYDYRVVKNEDAVCEIAFYQEGVEIGRSVFDTEDARKAGTKNLDKFPRNMLFARAMSNGVRWFVPDVFMGATVYTPEELGAEVDDEGHVIDVTPRPLHWSEQQTKKGTMGARFWDWTGGLGMDETEVLRVLDVSDLIEYTGTAEDAKATIEAHKLPKPMTAPQAIEEVTP